MQLGEPISAVPLYIHAVGIVLFVIGLVWGLVSDYNSKDKD